MALMYAWATKEYLLWEMTIGQIIMYNNKGIAIQNGESEQKPGLLNKTYKELRAMRDDARAQIELEKREEAKKDLQLKFGEIE
jgi:hypothetical protein